MFDDLSNPGSIGDNPNIGSTVVKAVKTQLTGFFEQQSPDEAQLTFLGATPLKLLRFGPDPDGIVTYATLGCSSEPMQDPALVAPDPLQGPRAELILPVRGGLDDVIRPLAMLAAAPTIEGLVLQEGALLDFASPLWKDSRFTGFIVHSSEVPDVEVSVGATDTAVVKLLQPVPATPNELALARARGVAELDRLWEEQGADLTDPHRVSVA